jgi:hypothetical protein
MFQAGKESRAGSRWITSNDQFSRLGVFQPEIILGTAHDRKVRFRLGIVARNGLFGPQEAPLRQDRQQEAQQTGKKETVVGGFWDFLINESVEQLRIPGNQSRLAQGVVRRQRKRPRLRAARQGRRRFNCFHHPLKSN